MAIKLMTSTCVFNKLTGNTICAVYVKNDDLNSIRICENDILLCNKYLQQSNIAAGCCIAITNSSGVLTISNKGIVAINGTTNQINVNNDAGSVTISLPSTISVSINGSASSASQLTTTRTFQISGDVTSTAQNFNGSANVVLPTSISATAVMCQPLSGLDLFPNSTILSTDTLICSLGKLQGQVNQKLTSFNGTGYVKTSGSNISYDNSYFVGAPTTSRTNDNGAKLWSSISGSSGFYSLSPDNWCIATGVNLISYISHPTLNNCGIAFGGNADGINKYFAAIRRCGKWSPPVELIHTENIANQKVNCSDNADKLDGYHWQSFTRAIGSANFGDSSGDITTAEFITILESIGAFEQPHWVARGNWSYAGNKTISDTGCGRIQLAGAVVEVFNNAIGKDVFTIKITTPTTATVGDTNAEFIYVNNGDGYLPGWRRSYNNYNANLSTVDWTAQSFKTNIDGGLGDTSAIANYVNGTLRWSIGYSNVETGTNSGTDFYIWHYDDEGNCIGRALHINRATGETHIGGNLTANCGKQVWDEGSANRYNVDWNAKELFVHSGIIRSNSPVSLLQINAGVAQKINVGGLLVSDTYENQSKVPTHGGWIQGNLFANNGKQVWDAGNANLLTVDWNARTYYSTVDGTAGSQIALSVKEKASNKGRWNIGTSTAESGSNVGSDFSIWRYADDGSYLGQAFRITRSTGDAAFTGNLTANNGKQVWDSGNNLIRYVENDVNTIPRTIWSASYNPSNRIVPYSTIYTLGGENTLQLSTAEDYNNTELYVRQYNNNASSPKGTGWQDWRKVYHSGNSNRSDVDWNANNLYASGNINIINDWQNNKGLYIKEGGSDAYGAYFTYGLNDELKIGTKTDSVDYDAIIIHRGLPDVNVVRNLTANGGKQVWDAGNTTFTKQDSLDIRLNRTNGVFTGYRTINAPDGDSQESAFGYVRMIEDSQSGAMIAVKYYGADGGNMYFQHHIGGNYGTWNKVWHSGNANLGTVDWTAKNVIVAGEVITSAPNHTRAIYNNRAVITRIDDSNYYHLVTNAGDQWGGFNSLRPFYFNLDTGNVTMGHSLSVGNTLSVGGNLTANNGKQVIDAGNITNYAAGSSYDVKIRDVRSDNFNAIPPSDSRYDNKMRIDFKDNLGLGRTWDSVMTIKGWSNDYYANQLAFNADGGASDESMYIRSGRTTWGSWRKVYDAGNSNRSDVDWNARDLNSNRAVNVWNNGVAKFTVDNVGNVTASGSITAGGNTVITTGNIGDYAFKCGSSGSISYSEQNTYQNLVSGVYTVLHDGFSDLIINFNQQLGSASGFQIYSDYAGNSPKYRTAIDSNRYSSWRTFIHSDNIGSQSVNYANSAGSANSVQWSNILGTSTASPTFAKLTSTGDIIATAFYVSSALKNKNVIGNWNENALDIINSTKIVEFTYKNDLEKNRKIGFIADDTNSLLSTKNLDQMDLYNTIGVMMKAMQELNDKYNKLEDKYNKLIG